MADSDPDKTLAVVAADVPARTMVSNYPEPFYSRMTKRQKRVLGDVFGLKNFGVNMTRLAPGGESSVMHQHTRQDEFIFVVEGTPTLVTDRGEVQLRPGMCAGFPAGGVAHHVVNRSATDAVYLEFGDRLPGDTAYYPHDDLKIVIDGNGKGAYVHKDGRPY